MPLLPYRGGMLLASKTQSTSLEMEKVLLMLMLVLDYVV